LTPLSYQLVHHTYIKLILQKTLNEMEIHSPPPQKEHATNYNWEYSEAMPMFKRTEIRDR